MYLLCRHSKPFKKSVLLRKIILGAGSCRSNRTYPDRPPINRTRAPNFGNRNNFLIAPELLPKKGLVSKTQSCIIHNLQTCGSPRLSFSPPLPIEKKNENKKRVGRP